MKYTFKYRKGFFWKTIKLAKGHAMNDSGTRMDVFLDDGIISISEWDKCDMKLGSDFMLSQKEAMEDESGQNIKVNKD